jgi:hypothetical protein
MTKFTDEEKQEITTIFNKNIFPNLTDYLLERFGYYLQDTSSRKFDVEEAIYQTRVIEASGFMSYFRDDFETWDIKLIGQIISSYVVKYLSEDKMIEFLEQSFYLYEQEDYSSFKNQVYHYMNSQLESDIANGGFQEHLDSFM